MTSFKVLLPTPVLMHHMSKSVLFHMLRHREQTKTYNTCDNTKEHICCNPMALIPTLSATLEPAFWTSPLSGVFLATSPPRAPACKQQGLAYLLLMPQLLASQKAYLLCTRCNHEACAGMQHIAGTLTLYIAMLYIWDIRT